MTKEPPTYQGKVRFGMFEADLRAYELRKAGIRVKLQSQPFKLLAILLEHAGEVVTREDLQRQIWGPETVVDFDHSLGTAVNKIREALGDSAEYPRYLETLAKRGYRFIAPVQVAEPPAPAAPPTEATAVPEVRPAPPPKLRTLTIGIAVAGGLAAGLLAGAWLFRSDASRSSDVVRGQSELRTFWSGVLRNQEPPLVTFSNAEFVGRPETGLRYFNPATDARQPVEDLYTGVGEALAIAGLSDAIHSLGRPIMVKRSRLLTWDQTKNRDLIFVGSPTENLSLRDLAMSREFHFRLMRPGEPRPGDLALVNEHPRPDEPRFFFASALPLTEDYALITLQPGPHPGQNVLLLAGTTTLGTQAAAEFVCHNDNLRALLTRLGVAPGGAVPRFSVVVHARVAGGVPVQIEIAAVRSPRK